MVGQQNLHVFFNTLLLARFDFLPQAFYGRGWQRRLARLDSRRNRLDQRRFRHHAEQKEIPTVRTTRLQVNVQFKSRSKSVEFFYKKLVNRSVANQFELFEKNGTITETSAVEFWKFQKHR